MRERRDPVELVQIGIPVLIEVAAVSLFIGAIFVWLIILATPMPV